jgi:ribosomal 50S subunit-recycling heat shock protein
MRLDLFLKKTCIVRQRSAAKEICDAGAVRVNGQIVKAAHVVQQGDVVRLQLAGRDLELRVVEVPLGNVARRDAGRYVLVLRDDRTDRLGRVFDSE